jgi:protein involved in polysaccharide export with SLBB domain
MKRLLLITLVFLFAGGAAEIRAQLPVPIPALNQSAPDTARPAATATGSAPAPAPGLMNGYVADDTYKLRTGDSVSFQILEDRILDLQDAPVILVVADSGELEVPYIGRVMAVGKTSKQLAVEIKAALEKDYYKTATVVLSLNTASRLLGRVYIWGQVRQQGGLDIEVNENLTAGKAILRAGGFADFANKKKVKVVRGNLDADGKKQSFELDMEQILEEGKIEKDIVLQPNDLIIVPSKLVNF